MPRSMRLACGETLTSKHDEHDIRPKPLGPPGAVIIISKVSDWFS